MQTQKKKKLVFNQFSNLGNSVSNSMKKVSDNTCILKQKEYAKCNSNVIEK